MNVWVTNASPLIFLAKLGRLNLLRTAADQVLVPAAVVAEVQEYDDFAASEVSIATETWLEMRQMQSGPLLKLLESELGAGEAATLALASEVQAGRVVLDDLEGRRWARKLELEIVGTLGLLLAAKLRGEIPSLAECVESLRSHGFRAGDALVEQILDRAGEAS